MKESKEVILAEDMPTYRLKIVKGKEEGKEIVEFRYFTEKQARQIAEDINSPNKFLVLGRTEFFPKFNCSLEEMTKEELRNRYRKHFRRNEEIRQKQEAEKYKMKRRKVDEFIEQNPERYREIYEYSKQKVENLFGKREFWKELSEENKEIHYKNQSRIEILSLKNADYS